MRLQLSSKNKKHKWLKLLDSGGIKGHNQEHKAMVITTYETIGGDYIISDVSEDSPLATLKTGSELRQLNNKQKQYLTRELTRMTAEVLNAAYINGLSGTQA